MRLSELAKLGVGEVDLDDKVTIVTGNGRRARACPFGSRTAQAPDRYLRARSRHPHADLPAVTGRQRSGGDDRQRHCPDVVPRAAAWVPWHHPFKRPADVDAPGQPQGQRCHVGPHGVLGSTSVLRRAEPAVWVNLFLEASQGRLAGRARCGPTGRRFSPTRCARPCRLGAGAARRHVSHGSQLTRMGSRRTVAPPSLERAFSVPSSSGVVSGSEPADDGTTP
jgi:hypothetical protein